MISKVMIYFSSCVCVCDYKKHPSKEDMNPLSNLATRFAQTMLERAELK